MTSQLTIETLKTSAEYIVSEVKKGDKALMSALEHYRNAGEKLAEIKFKVKSQGKRQKNIGFEQWVKDECGFTRKTAYRYITLFENWDLLMDAFNNPKEEMKVMSLRKALAFIKTLSQLQEEDDDNENKLKAEAIKTIATAEKRAQKIFFDATAKLEAANKDKEEARKKLIELDSRFAEAESAKISYLQKSKEYEEKISKIKQKEEDAKQKLLLAHSKAQGILDAATREAAKSVAAERSKILHDAIQEAKKITSNAEEEEARAKKRLKELDEEYQRYYEEKKIWLDPERTSEALFTQAMGGVVNHLAGASQNENIKEEHVQRMKYVAQQALLSMDFSPRKNVWDVNKTN